MIAEKKKADAIFNETKGSKTQMNGFLLLFDVARLSRKLKAKDFLLDAETTGIKFGISGISVVLNVFKSIQTKNVKNTVCIVTGPCDRTM
jgi:hypothetical protein